MNLRTALARVLARDSRYSFQAYQFIFESLDFAKSIKKRKLEQSRRRKRPPRAGDLAVSGQEICLAARDLALRQYGLLTLTVLHEWGIRSTRDLGNIVYNLIDSGDFESTPGDSRSDFDDVYDFEAVFRRDFVLPLDDVA